MVGVALGLVWTGGDSSDVHPTERCPTNYLMMCCPFHMNDKAVREVDEAGCIRSRLNCHVSWNGQRGYMRHTARYHGLKREAF